MASWEIPAPENWVTTSYMCSVGPTTE